MENMHWLQETQSCYKEWSFSTSIYRLNATKTSWTIVLLFSWWVLRLQSNSRASSRLREDNFHLSVWYFCLWENSIWIMQHSNYISNVHPSYLVSFGWEKHWSFQGWLLCPWWFLWCMLEKPQHCTEKMHRDQPSGELGKISFYG